MVIVFLFFEWDIDGSGMLCSEEFLKFFCLFGDDMINDMDVNMVMCIFDKNEIGEIDFGEFVKWYKDGVKFFDMMIVSKLGVDDFEDIDFNMCIDEIIG